MEHKDTRTKILDAALDLFAHYGYDAVGVQAIVDAVSVTKPTLYHHFGSKKGLFEVLIREKSAPLLQLVSEAAAYHGDVTQSIRLVVHTYFDYVEAEPLFCRMILGMWFAPPSSECFATIGELMQQQYTLLEDLFRHAATNHGNMRGRHQAYAVSLKGTIDTYLGLRLQGYVDLQADDLRHRIVHQFMHGIFS